jgi:anaerobic ribonucleoside-triphosphate reductase
MNIKFVKKRNGDIASFDKNLIKNAIEKAYLETEKK